MHIVDHNTGNRNSELTQAILFSHRKISISGKLLRAATELLESRMRLTSHMFVTIRLDYRARIG